MSIDHRAGPLTKRDLQFIYPKGVAGGDDPRLRKHPDKDFLNRDEWYEMLWFCNYFANTHAGQGADPKQVALKAERLIFRKLVPPHLHSHEHIEDWLLKNWDKYQGV